MVATRHANDRPRRHRAPIWRSIFVHSVLIAGIGGLSNHPGAVLHQASAPAARQGEILRASLWSSPLQPGRPMPPVSVQPVSTHQPVAGQALRAAVEQSAAAPLTTSGHAGSTMTDTSPPHRPPMPSRRMAAPISTNTAARLAGKTASHRAGQQAAHPLTAPAAVPVTPTSASVAAAPATTPASTPAAAPTTMPASTSAAASATMPVSTPAAAPAKMSVSDPPGGPVITQPQYLGSPPQLDYPALARRRGQQGRVLVEVWLDSHGQVVKSTVLSSPGIPALEQAALRYVAASRFAPYLRDGQGHAARLHLSVDFRLHD